MLDTALIASILIVFVVFVFYKCWYRPRKLMKNYVKIMRERGYKVYEIPYNPFFSEAIDSISTGYAQGDAMLNYKTKYQGYDAIVTNVLIYPEIKLLGRELIEAYYAVDKHYEFPKIYKIADVYQRAAGCGVILSEGAAWKRKRTILNKLFNFDFIKGSTAKIAECCDLAISEIESENKVENGEVTYDVLNFTIKSFSKVMLSLFLGGTNKERINGQPAGQFIKKLFNDLADESLKPINFLLGSRFMDLGLTAELKSIKERVEIYKKWSRQFLTKKIESIKAEISENKDGPTQSGDLIKSLMIAHLEESKTGDFRQKRPSLQDEIFEQFTTFFIAGIDSTSTYAQMIIYELARHPEIQRKVREEIAKFMSTDDYSYENLKNLTYLQLVQKQMIRLYGPAVYMFQRQAARDNYLGDVPVHKDTVLTVMFYAKHFSQKYFRQPRKFIPERWESQCDNLPAFAYGGFSGGARSCIGKHLAMLESKIAIVKFLKRYSSIQLGKQDFKMGFKIIYGPESFKSKLILA